MADEGFWVHDARNAVQFGAFADDDWHNRIVSPLIHPPVYLLFRLLSPGLVAVRVWAACLALLTLWGLDRVCRRLDPSGWLFMAFAVNSILVAYQRTAILESAVLPVAVLSLWVWLRARETRTLARGWTWDIAAGIAATMTWLVKSTQLPILAAMILATVLIEPHRKRRFQAVICQILGMAGVAVIWAVMIAGPHGDLLAHYNRFYLSQHGETLNDFVFNVIQQPAGIYFSRMPVLFPAALLVWTRLLLHRHFHRVPPAVTFAWSWFTLGLASLAPLGYRPLRYYLPLIIPTVILGWHWAFGQQDHSPPQWVRWIAAAVTLVFVLTPVPILAARFAPSGVLARFSTLAGVAGFPFIEAILCLAVTIGILIPYTCAGRFPSHRMMVMLLAISFVFHTGWMGFRLATRRYDVVEASRALARMIGPESVVAGQWAPQLCLETRFRAIPMWKGFVNDTDPVGRFGVTHVVSWEYVLGNEYRHQREWFPDMMTGARRVAVFRIKDSDVSVWEVAEMTDSISP